MFTIGLGFRQGVSAAQIEAAICAALQALPHDALLLNAAIASIAPSEPSDPSATGIRAGEAFRSILCTPPLRDCIASVATLDLKAQEPGLLAFCAAQQIGLRYYSREILATLPGTSAASSIVQRRYGLDGICESAALAALPDGRLWLAKTSTLGVSVAVAGVVR